jgi:hypothetical protein
VPRRRMARTPDSSSGGRRRGDPSRGRSAWGRPYRPFPPPCVVIVKYVSRKCARVASSRSYSSCRPGVS